MEKILYYLWKGILVVVSICTLPIILEFANYAFSVSGNSVVNFCGIVIFMVIIIGLLVILGYNCYKLIELYKPKTK